MAVRLSFSFAQIIIAYFSEASNQATCRPKFCEHCYDRIANLVTMAVCCNGTWSRQSMRIAGQAIGSRLRRKKSGLDVLPSYPSIAARSACICHWTRHVSCRPMEGHVREERGALEIRWSPLPPCSRHLDHACRCQILSPGRTAEPVQCGHHAQGQRFQRTVQSNRRKIFPLVRPSAAWHLVPRIECRFPGEA
jgi:hypothetical protein